MIPNPYPDTGPLAVLARIGFLVWVVAIAAATALSGPHLLFSYNLEHFAAFYLLALSAAAAVPRARLRWLGVCILAAATVSEFARLGWTPPGVVLERWCADLGGAMACYVPMIIQRFRRRFPPRPAKPPGLETAAAPEGG